MKHEHAINVPFMVNRNTPTQVRLTAVPAKSGCTGCHFLRMGYAGFATCLVDGPTRCGADARCDNTSIIYVKA